MTNNKIQQFKELPWREQYSYREGLLDSYNIILDSIQDQMINNDLAANKEMYDACDKLAKDLRNYLNAICSIDLNV